MSMTRTLSENYGWYKRGGGVVVYQLNTFNYR